MTTAAISSQPPCLPPHPPSPPSPAKCPHQLFMYPPGPAGAARAPGRGGETGPRGHRWTRWASWQGRASGTAGEWGLVLTDGGSIRDQVWGNFPRPWARGARLETWMGRTNYLGVSLGWATVSSPGTWECGPSDCLLDVSTQKDRPFLPCLVDRVPIPLLPHSESRPSPLTILSSSWSSHITHRPSDLHPGV